MNESVKYNEINYTRNNEDYAWEIIPAPKFGKTFKPIGIKQTGYDDGDGRYDSLFEVELLDLDDWDIFDDFDGRYVKEFADEILEKFYELVEKDDPKIKEYVIENDSGTVTK
jgi:hypothetical protein